MKDQCSEEFNRKIQTKFNEKNSNTINLKEEDHMPKILYKSLWTFNDLQKLGIQYLLYIIE